MKNNMDSFSNTKLEAMADSQSSRSHYKEAGFLLSVLLQRREELGSSKLISILLKFAYCLSATGEHSKAGSVLRNALTECRQLEGEKTIAQTRSSVLEKLGECLMAQTRWADAAEAFRQSLKLFKQYTPAQNKERGIVSRLSKLAQCLEEMGRTADALKGRREILQIVSQTPLSADNPRYARYAIRQMAALANCLKLLGRSAGAAASYREALEKASALLGRHDQLTLAIMQELGRLFVWSGLICRS